MDRHSHSNKGPPSGSSPQTDAEIIKGSDIAGAGYFDLRDLSELGRTFAVIKRPYVISNAYTEPVGIDPVEQFILQRNYIID
jgi:hypothetical protein